MRRRSMLAGSLAGAGALAGGGCGFRPLYMPEGGRGSPAAAELAAVYVPVIRERTGQLLRQALQQRLAGSGSGAAMRYELDVTEAISAEGIAIQSDSSISRVRLIGSGAWALRLLDPQKTLLTQGRARVLDGYNILNQQYFAADLESETAYRRIADTLAQRIVTEVAIFLKRRAAQQAPA